VCQICNTPFESRKDSDKHMRRHVEIKYDIRRKKKEEKDE
jgi:hypothetical protein